MGRRDKKKPKKKIDPIEGKSVRVSPQTNPENYHKKKITWGFGLLDRDGPFGWSNVAPGLLWETIWPFLKSLETMTIAEILRASGGRGAGGGNNSHNVPVGDLSQEANKRLGAIGMDDLEEMFSLRISGKQRILGKLEGNILKIMWFDPDHGASKTKK